MARDKNYGSGKSVTANASRSRARVAAGRFTKGKKRAVDNLVSKVGEVADFAFNGPKEIRGKYSEVGVSPLKLAAIAKGLFKSGRQSQALSVADRAFVKNAGRALGTVKNMARQQPMGNYAKGGNTIENLQDLRTLTRDVFPKRPGPGKQPGSTLRRVDRKEILTSVGKPKSVIKIVPRASATARMQKFAKDNMTAGEKYRQSLGGKSTRVGELEKRLNLPKRGR